MAYTTTHLISAIERQSFSPANQSTFETAAILSLSDEVTKTAVIPAIMSAREEYFITYVDYPITEGVSAYRVPARAIGLAVRDIQIITDSGSVRTLSRTSLDRRQDYTATASSPAAFYLQGDDVIITPTPTSTVGTLRVYYPLRPGELVETSAAAVVSAINTSTNVVTVTAIPSTWATGNVFDLIQQDGGHRYLSTDLTSTLISGTAITLPSLPTTLAVGDYITLRNTSPVVQLPPDFQPILATLTAAELLIAQGIPAGEKMLAKAARALDMAQKLLTPRVVGEYEVILPDWT